MSVQPVSISAIIRRQPVASYFLGLVFVGFITVAAIRWLGSSANNVFSTVDKAAAETSLADRAETSLVQAKVLDRKLIRKGTIDLIVKDPAQCAERIRETAEKLGGYLVASETGQGIDAKSSSLIVRIPVSRLQEARTEIRSLGLRIVGERQQAQDVSKEFVDQEARLRNLQAQEAQYLSILKQAKTVKDTMTVAEKLDDVRGEIERQQGEFNALSRQVETVELAISLRTETVPVEVGWWANVKQSARGGWSAVVDYGTTMTAFFFYIPAIALWLATVVITTGAIWKSFLWIGRKLAAPPATPSA